MPLRIPDGAKYIEELASTGWPNLATLWNKHAPYPDIDPRQIRSVDVKFVTDIVDAWGSSKKVVDVEFDLWYPSIKPDEDVEYRCSYRIIPEAFDAANTPIKFRTTGFYMTITIGGEETEVEKESVKGRSYVGPEPPSSYREFIKTAEYLKSKRDEERLKVLFSKRDTKEMTESRYHSSKLDDMMSKRRHGMRHTVAGMPTSPMDVSALKVNRDTSRIPPAIHRIGFIKDRIESGYVLRVNCSCATDRYAYCQSMIEWYAKKSAIPEVLGHAHKLTQTGDKPVFLLPFCRGYVRYKCVIRRDSFNGETVPDALVVEDFFNERLKFDISGERGETLRDALSIVTRHYENTNMYDEMRERLDAIYVAHDNVRVTKNPIGCESINHRRVHDERLRKVLNSRKSPSASDWMLSMPSIALGNAYTMLTYGTCAECCTEFFYPTEEELPF